VKWYRPQGYYDEGGWRGTRRWEGGGSLMNQSIHAIDLLQWLAGMPVRASAFTSTVEEHLPAYLHRLRSTTLNKRFHAVGHRMP